MEQWRKNLIILWVGTVVAGVSFSIVSPFLPALLENLGVAENLEIWSGWAFSASFYSSALLYPVWGALADKYGRRPQLLRSAGWTLALDAEQAMGYTDCSRQLRAAASWRSWGKKNGIE
ncbi:MAG: MFS transporter [Bacillota bacterium]|jgi:MFS family permease